MLDQKFKYKTNCLHAAPQFSNHVENTECCKNRTEATLFSVGTEVHFTSCMLADIYLIFHCVMTELFSHFFFFFFKKISFILTQGGSKT